MTTDGFRAVPRTHLSMIAGGLALSLESNVAPRATIMSAFAPCSFAGVASSLAMWLLTGGTLVLHHPFDSDVLEQQIVESSCDTLVAPAQLALRLDELGLSARMPGLRNVMGLWRSPEQVVSSASWRTASLTMSICSAEAGIRRAPRQGWHTCCDKPDHMARRANCRLVDLGRNPAHAARSTGAARPMVTVAAYAAAAQRP
jgi:hypothetical protein